MCTFAALFTINHLFMKVRKSDFFPEEYCVSGITDDDYRKVKRKLSGELDMLSRVTNCGYYVVDYFKNNFLYVSENIAYWCGQPSDKVREMGFELFNGFVPDGDLAKLIEIHNEWIRQLMTMPIDDWSDTSLIFDFRFQGEKSYRMVNQKVTPYTIRNGKIWLELCILSLSSEEQNQFVVMKKRKADWFYEYSLKKHTWCRRILKTLTASENEVFLLSVRGFACKQIADMLGRSEETIKIQRKAILKRLGVSSFASVAVHAVNYDLLPMYKDTLNN